uniref:Erythromycin biosynthesis protein CIII-like C-terminal domain-containing protein n=1 Tax=Leersia perrieri TaxID=77586 RepID=A0A0D9V882_9ORYZ
MGEFVLRSMDARFSGSVDADGFPYSRQPGFGHSKSTTASPGYSKEQEHVYVRSYSDRLLKCDLTLDMLSENEKIKIIENLVKIQNDGTLEVDAKRSALIASELSEIDAFGSLSRDILEATSGLSKPTNEFPHPLARMPQSATYRLSYLILDLVIWWGTRGFINEFRKKLKLAPIAYFSTYHGSISHLPTGYMWSPHLMPKPNDWGPLVDVVGYCFLNLGTKYQPPQEFSQWLQQGLKPIYIGFGSMPLGDEKRVTSIILDALRETGQRGIISRGWGDLGSFSEVPVDVFILEDCPHDWLFPRCAAVVHHGGAGTTAAGLVAGCPTTVVPFFGDQFFWGERIHAQGVGPAPIPIAELTVEALSNAIGFMLDPEVKSRTMELAIAIGNEDGVAAAVDSFHRHLPAELPLAPPSTDVVEEERLDFFQWFSQALEKCCFPFNP